MAKDPRFNFYPDNYEGGTKFFSLEEDGAYLRLLMLQFSQEHFTEKQGIILLMQRCPESPQDAKRLWASIKHKFATDGTVFWNVKLRTEMEKSLQYSEDQSKRAKMGWDKRKADADASAYTTAHAEPMPNGSPKDASNTNSNSTSNTTTKTTSNKNTAEADVYAFDRSSVISELNALTGRAFDPDADYFKKNLNARIKQYGVPDLIDMIRFIVYKRKGTDFEQYLKPDTIFRPEKSASYMADMKHHRDNGLMPKRDVKSNIPKTAKEIYEAGIESMNRKKSVFQ